MSDLHTEADKEVIAIELQYGYEEKVAGGVAKGEIRYLLSLNALRAFAAAMSVAESKRIKKLEQCVAAPAAKLDFTNYAASVVYSNSADMGVSTRNAALSEAAAMCRSQRGDTNLRFICEGAAVAIESLKDKSAAPVAPSVPKLDYDLLKLALEQTQARLRHAEEAIEKRDAAAPVAQGEALTLVVPHEMGFQNADGPGIVTAYVNGWNDCRATLLGEIPDDPTCNPAIPAKRTGSA